MSKKIKPIICPYCSSIDTYVRGNYDSLTCFCGKCSKTFSPDILEECMEVEDGMSPLYDQNTSFIKKYDDIDGKNYTVFSVTSNNGLIINMLMEEELNKGFSYKRMAFYDFMEGKL